MYMHRPFLLIYGSLLNIFINLGQLLGFLTIPGWPYMRVIYSICYSYMPYILKIYGWLQPSSQPYLGMVVKHLDWEFLLATIYMIHLGHLELRQA
jgi:hypothetical protein